MKKFTSMSLTVLAATLLATLSFGCGEGIEGETGSQSAEVIAGQCNAIAARVLGTAQQCSNFGCGESECAELLGAFNEFFVDPGECATAAGMDELNGLPGNAFTQPNGPNAGEPKQIQEVICGSAEACGICAAVQSVGGICLATDACNP